MVSKSKILCKTRLPRQKVHGSPQILQNYFVNVPDATRPEVIKNRNICRKCDDCASQR